ncbi:twitch domain-containing radical SAM protein [bacterium]|nr:twitch domain-containing radical SAM protein [bacterium]
MNESYCTMAWNSIHWDANGRSAPCCQFRGKENNFFAKSADEYFKSDWLKDIKQKMTDGIKIPGCDRCYKQEAANGTSMRTRREHLPIDEIHEIHLTYSNICNKACNICRPYRSHLIGNEYKKMFENNPSSPFIVQKYAERQNRRLVKGELKFDGLNVKVLESLKPYASQIKIMSLSGGEPFMHPELHIILDWLLENAHKDLKVIITSNGSWTQQYIDKLKKFKSVEMIISIDGIKELYPVVRPPHSWEWFVQQEKMLDGTHIDRRYEAVMHLLNVHQLADIVRHFKDKGKVFLAPLSQQEYLGCHLVPDEVILKVADELEELEHKSSADYLRHHSKITNTTDANMFFEFLKANEPVKNINYQSVIPWSFDLLRS